MAGLSPAVQAELWEKFLAMPDVVELEKRLSSGDASVSVTMVLSLQFQIHMLTARLDAVEKRQGRDEDGYTMRGVQ